MSPRRPKVTTVGRHLGAYVNIRRNLSAYRDLTMKSPATVFAFLLLACLLPLTASADNNWPQWRGPSGDGICSESNIPTKWSETENIVWKTPIPEFGRSTPIIWNNAIFLTAHADDKDLLLLKLDKQTGNIEWSRKIGEAQTPRMEMRKKIGEERRHQKFHSTQNLASPSPVTNGEVVVVHFGNGDTAAYDFDGNSLWKRNFQQDYGPYTIWWGHANSPILVDGMLISACMNDACRDLPGTPSESYVVAHDAKTGREIWKTSRVSEAEGEFADGYTTPVLWNVGGRKEVLVMGGEILDAYDPATGKRLWYLPQVLGNRPVTGPVATGDCIFATHGKRGPFFAFRPKRAGEESHDSILWKHKKGTPDSPWPVVTEGMVFWVNDNGIVYCLDAQTGEEHWKKRLDKGPYRASPMVADGRVFFLSTKGLATVVQVAKECEVVAENTLDDELYASPVVSDGRLYLRGKKHLYCIGR